nr:unnamed protein product [Callosobruchus analis]CAI5865427.1 unnamed protein product [Callosobruchus analis]CAI5867566.1 unnamed protein product [Callosobruchus analis]
MDSSNVIFTFSCLPRPLLRLPLARPFFRHGAPVASGVFQLERRLAGLFASGSPQPQVDWLGADGQPAGDVPGVRRVLRNGTLYLMPFAAHAYRQDVHSTIYRCMASNSVVECLAGMCKLELVSTGTWLLINGFLPIV